MAKAEPGSHTEGECVPWGPAAYAGGRGAGSPGPALLWVSQQVHADIATFANLL